MVELQQHLDEYGMKCCPIDNSLKIFGKKFTMHIIRNMILLKQKRFNEFLKSVEGINTKSLSVRLHEMEDSGLVKRTIIERRPLHVEYELTDKGKSLEPILVQMANFSMTWEPKTVLKSKKQTTVKEVYGNERLSKVWD